MKNQKMAKHLLTPVLVVSILATLLLSLPLLPAGAVEETGTSTGDSRYEIVQYIDAGGNVATPTVGEKMTFAVSGGPYATTVISPLGVGADIKASADFAFKTKAITGAKGIMMYIKTPDSEEQTVLAPYFYKGSTQIYTNFSGATWYYSSKSGNYSSWTAAAVTVSVYGIELPAKFEGYVYIPFDQFGFASNKITDDSSFNGFGLYENWYNYGGNQEKEHIYGAPIAVYASGLTNDVPNLSDFIAKRQESEPQEPETEVLQYEIAQYVDKFSDGGEVITPKPGDQMQLAGGIKPYATDVISPLGVESDIKASADFDIKTKPITGAKGVMIYVKTPQDTSESTIFAPFFYKNASGQSYQLNSGTWYYSSKAGNYSAWTSATVGNKYGIELPNKFEGYLYIPFTQIGNNGGYITDADSFSGYGLWQNFYNYGGNQEKEHIYSAPIAVFEGGLTDNLPNLSDFIAKRQKVSAKKGAQVRGEDAQGNTALRFGFTLDCANVTYANADPESSNDYSRDLTKDPKVTIGGKVYQLIDFGALVSAKADLALNMGEVNDTNGKKIAKVPAINLYDVATGKVTYTAVITNVASDKKDVTIYARSYVQYKDDSGVTHYMYGEKFGYSVNSVLPE